jgi:hypothetical protein
MRKNAKVLIYGSCVARDLFEIVRPGEAPLAYVARQSLISATSHAIPTTATPSIDLPSAFQRRMVENDFRSSLFATMTEHGENSDLFLVDLVDERLGVYSVPGGSYVTGSNEVHRSGALNRLPGLSNRIAFGTDEHFALWSRAVDAFAVEVDRLGMLKKTVLIRATFATRSDDGRDLGTHIGNTSEEWNHLYKRYYERAGILGLSAVAIPGDCAVGSTTHRWGLAPYHYVETAYLSLAEQIERTQPWQ